MLHDFEALDYEIKEFRDSCKTINIASLSPNGEVVISYAPYIESSGKYYIYISEITPHFGSIKANPNNIEIMFIQDESKANNIFARVRLIYRAKASFIKRDSKQFDLIFDEFQKKNNNISEIEILRNMSDFHLIRFEFSKGRFIKGFGKAYEIDRKIISHINPKNPHKFK
ncbi:pyridoxamine 5'-phosphate oxidase family protein [Helicobacter sp. MIT 99-5507]|uniref:pyridoxamine 5'-phosphate oxidase family protein n=1 Tax=Helicobacter sp. MIT 99-5507 TaxID=152489 RepID=UPI000E1E77FF|nr:pyridoxamine 5'-phosphate oxidase family protein [Helicobacter sp. MIT 99-5507]RDU58265.1 hypothetical protein CQA42_00210 [Helicobacter sp. MIT 99-5507]